MDNHDYPLCYGTDSQIALRYDARDIDDYLLYNAADIDDYCIIQWIVKSLCCIKHQKVMNSRYIMQRIVMTFLSMIQHRSNCSIALCSRYQVQWSVLVVDSQNHKIVVAQIVLKETIRQKTHLGRPLYPRPRKPITEKITPSTTFVFR